MDMSTEGAENYTGWLMAGSCIFRIEHKHRWDRVNRIADEPIRRLLLQT